MLIKKISFAFTDIKDVRNENNNTIEKFDGEIDYFPRLRILLARNDILFYNHIEADLKAFIIF